MGSDARAPERSRGTAGGETAHPRSWWGRVRIPTGKAGRWRIGPAEILVQHLENEWRIAWETGDDPLRSDLETELPAAVTDLMGRETLDRFGTSAQDETITILPALADRPVVARPERPFHVGERDSVTIFVGSPVWIRIDAGEPSRRLLDRPVFRPSDTWFGPITGGGELCYASRAFCRLRLEELPIRPHRATTAVHVRNRASSPLTVERLRLPVPNLELRASPGGRLFTPDVTFERKEDGDFVSLEVGRQASWASLEGELLAGPRTPISKGAIVRAFGSLLHPRG